MLHFSVTKEINNELYENVTKFMYPKLNELEIKKAALTDKMNRNSPDDDLNKVMIEFGEITKLIDEKTERWIELAEFM